MESCSRSMIVCSHMKQITAAWAFPFSIRDLCMFQVRTPAVLQPLQVWALISVARLHGDHPQRQCVQTRGAAWGLQGSPVEHTHWRMTVLWLCSCCLRANIIFTISSLFFMSKVRCGKCGNGLGHEFVNDGPSKGLSRFWIFSSSLKFIPKGMNDYTFDGAIFRGSSEP